MRISLAVVAALLVAALSSPATAQDIAASSVYSDRVTALAAAWTDVPITSMDCVSELCRTNGEVTQFTIYSSGAAASVLLRGEAGEATSATMYVPSGGSITFNVYGTGTVGFSVHGDGNTPTVYIVAGFR